MTVEKQKKIKRTVYRDSRGTVLFWAIRWRSKFRFWESVLYFLISLYTPPYQSCPLGRGGVIKFLESSNYFSKLGGKVK
jgi:hypothetical protein